ncbi:uncharacterized protein BDV17DRAFT_156529 [Aspergillus undulatus]|uniref:uncharacterized protein n=1 Tax=Aspergillus undulatus TaxID=1810928 RepID=UPI003CCC9DF2
MSMINRTSMLSGPFVSCRHGAETGTPILDHYLNRFIVPQNASFLSTCAHCPYPEAWFHPDCYFVLESIYKGSDGPAPEHFKELADAVTDLYPRDTGNRDRLSVLEGLPSSWVQDLMHDSFSQDLFKRLPPEIQLLITDFIGPLWYLVVLGQAR